MLCRPGAVDEHRERDQRHRRDRAQELDRHAQRAVGPAAGADEDPGRHAEQHREAEPDRPALERVADRRPQRRLDQLASPARRSPRWPAGCSSPGSARRARRPPTVRAGAGPRRPAAPTSSASAGPRPPRAVSTISAQLVRTAARAVSALPSTVEEKPHCGDRQSWSTSTYCDASSMRRLSSSLVSSSPRLVVTRPSTTSLPLGTKRSGSKPPERASSHSMKKPSTSSSLNSASATKS